MKKILLNIFLFTYATIVFKPLLPYINDFVAHVCWYSQHMATAHFENGEYHVHAESQEITKKDYTGKTHSTFKKNLSENEYFVIAEKYTSPMLSPAKTCLQSHSYIYKNIFSHTVFPPPKS